MSATTLTTKNDFTCRGEDKYYCSTQLYMKAIIVLNERKPFELTTTSRQKLFEFVDSKHSLDNQG